MEVNEENLDAIMAMVSEMEHMKGFPRTEQGLKGYAKGICRIIQDQPHMGITIEKPGGKTALETAQELIDFAMEEYSDLPPIVELYDRYKGKGLGYRPADQGPCPASFVRECREKVLHDTSGVTQ